MRISTKGQVTIPQAIRERFGLLPDTEVEFVAKRNGVRIVKSKSSTKPTRGEVLVGQLRGRSSVKMTTEEILALTRK